MVSRNHRRLVQLQVRLRARVTHPDRNPEPSRDPNPNNPNPDLQVNAEPKVDASGSVVGVVCVGQDVYSQKEMVREHLENLKLKEINRTKDAPLA